ncbi:hypothetical protein IOD14_42995 [Streptomyces sp. A2-16]|uniref:HEPN domain-containing protein n=1 Tax=Streptomyces sp. A2-16 TaxID=2781734 RepID=UPI001BAE8D70|nr:HEPN domain-containing protein [Streptomyces sp. A2-16]QUC62980.1 hypothetical protein IOD14_42995 [Streptomyces sp. A2-16]
MGTYYAPLAGLIPEGFSEPTQAGAYGLVPRKWEVSLFDWAELGSKHNLHIPYTVGDTRLKGCNLELAITGESIEDAQEKIAPFHVMMYAREFHPFSVQFISSHSINEYAGICSRKSSYGIDLLPEGLREGITSDTASVEIWGAPYSSGSSTRREALNRSVTPNLFAQVAEDVEKWIGLRDRYPVCLFLERVLTSSPVVPDVGQSLLHVWTGLESIFPKVQSEVSFRLALYLAQLQSPLGDRQDFFQRAKRSYGDRSKVAHGGVIKTKGGVDPWMEAWSILTHTVRAILERRSIPTEEDLIQELLAAADAGG